MKPTEVHKLTPKIAVIGIGGAGGNAVNNMISSNLEGCQFLVCNTDAQALNGSLAQDKIQLGINVTGGLGAGSKPEIGQAAAEESLEEVLQYLDGANMAFITAGMGGGTGTGAAPVIAKACRQQGILTVGVVTKPFHFEGAHRMEQAERGIAEMQGYVDTLIVIPNQNLFRIANEKTTFAEAFRMADSVLQSGVRGVTDLMVRPGLVNLDFADIRTAMLQMGKAMMGTGEASGDKRALQAAEAAINNPLLDDVSMKGAQGVIINVTGGYDMTLFEADEACNRIRDEVDPNANIIFGATFDESMEGLMRVSIVATGIDREARKAKIFSGTGSAGGGSGNIKPEQPLPMERSKPNTDVAAKTHIHPARTALTGREAVRAIKAPVSLSASAHAPPTREVETSPQTENENQIEVYEQAEFPVENQEQITLAQNTALRGTTYKDAFIPPMPMEPEMDLADSSVGPHISSYHGAHVTQEQPSEVGTASNLRLTPPKPGALAQKRSPSLLERITGSVQQHIENLRDDSETTTKSGTPAKGQQILRGGLSAQPSQASLNISAPAGKPASKIDDELDIPAFLRRQAN